MGRSEVTQVLMRITAGETAADTLIPLVYEDLHALAARAMRQERPNHTLQPTALIHEAYLRVVDQTRVDWKGRTHFFAICAEAIHRILIDHARKRGAQKRSGDRAKVSLEHAADEPAGDAATLDHLALAEALEELEILSERQARVVKLRFFGGLTAEEISEVLGVSDRTVKDDWRVARAWLMERLA